MSEHLREIINPIDVTEEDIKSVLLDLFSNLDPDKIINWERQGRVTPMLVDWFEKVEGDKEKGRDVLATTEMRAILWMFIYTLVKTSPLVSGDDAGNKTQERKLNIEMLRDAFAYDVEMFDSALSKLDELVLEFMDANGFDEETGAQISDHFEEILLGIFEENKIRRIDVVENLILYPVSSRLRSSEDTAEILRISGAIKGDMERSLDITIVPDVEREHIRSRIRMAFAHIESHLTV